MLAPSRASEEYEAQKRLAVATIAAVRHQWRQVRGDWSRSFDRVGPRIQAILTAGQIRSVRSGAAYVPDVLEQQGQHVKAVGSVSVASLVGRAADGRDLATLLPGAVVRAKGAGSLDAGEKWLDMVVETELADAHRAAIQVATVARPGTGWVRMVNTPCCRDCALLAGAFYRANEGFLRHARCRCYHLPTTDPRSKYATYPAPSEITGLTDGERRALEAGGDYSQVLNAARGRDRTRGVRVTDPSKMTTTEGRTKHSIRGRGRGRPYQRLTPDGIYRLATDEDQAVDLLRRFGYLL